MFGPKSISNAGAADGDKYTGTRLKVWDSLTGDLLRIISSVSHMETKTLCAHPTEPNIILTTGRDGILNLWNVEQEEKLYSAAVTTPAEDGQPVAVWDAVFSPDGSRIALSDDGSVTIFGLDDPDHFKGVLSEQYFTSDYSQMSHDTSGFAIDTGTQVSSSGR